VEALVVVLVLFVGWRWARNRRKHAQAQNDIAAGFGAVMPRPWAGPSRLNGRPALRLPRKVPTPTEQLSRRPSPLLRRPKADRAGES
jgi:hypothetical protein